MGKVGKQRRDAHYHEQAQFVRALEETVNALLPRFRSFDPPVVDWHHVGPFTPTPDDHWIYYVVATDAESNRADASHLAAMLRKDTIDELARREYPESGRASLIVRIVSQEAIDAGGGSFAYFR